MAEERLIVEFGPRDVIPGRVLSWTELFGTTGIGTGDTIRLRDPDLLAAAARAITASSGLESRRGNLFLVPGRGRRSGAAWLCLPVGSAGRPDLVPSSATRGRRPESLLPFTTEARGWVARRSATEI